MTTNIHNTTVEEFTNKYLTEHGHKPGVFVNTFGCQQNEADSEQIVGICEALGYEKVLSGEEAELVIFNTCAVREHAELKALSITGQLKHLKTANPNMILAVCGCMVAQEHRLNDIKHKYPYVDFLFGTSAKHKIPEYIESVIKTHKRAFYPDTDYSFEEGLPVHRESKYKALVSIMYGCDNFCTYCVVPYVRGRERSRRKEDILADVQTLADSGIKEIMFLGQNVNSYGKGLYTDYGFPELLEDICEIKGDYIIRFMSSHPKDASKKLIDVMAEHSKDGSMPRIAKQFHLPLQSGSDEILKKMNRHYTAEQYLGLIDYMREKIPDIAISTDIIVGFPTESDVDFENTLDMLKKVRYDAFFSFIYSIRKGTPAEKMEQVPEDIKKERFARMLEVQNAISLEKNRECIGKTSRILVEERSKKSDEFLTGRNEKNRLIHFKGDDSLIGTFVNVKITDADTYYIWGEII